MKEEAMNTHAIVTILVVALAGCGGSVGGAKMMTPDDGQPHVDPALEYMLQPGEEKFLCFSMNMPMGKDVVITKVVPSYGVGTHHILMAQTLTPEPDGFSECDVLIRNTWIPLYAGGKNSGPLALPDGSGFKLLVVGQQIVMQLHLLNSTPAPIADRTSLRIEYADAAPSIVPAGIFGLDNRRLSIPAHTQTDTTMTCVSDKMLHVFGVFGHMHKLGTHLRLSQGAASSAVLYDRSWTFDTQPIVMATFDVENGEMLTLDCTHDNTGDMPVAYGESTNDEMCSAVLYYTPYQSLDGCIQE
jgi:hypothetical protein